MGWALHVLALFTGVQGHMTDALPLFDRALTVTESDQALTDLRLLLQINKAVTLGNLDRYQEALTAAGQARHLGRGQLKPKLTVKIVKGPMTCTPSRSCLAGRWSSAPWRGSPGTGSPASCLGVAPRQPAGPAGCGLLSY